MDATAPAATPRLPAALIQAVAASQPAEAHVALVVAAVVELLHRADVNLPVEAAAATPVEVVVAQRQAAAAKLRAASHVANPCWNCSARLIARVMPCSLAPSAVTRVVDPLVRLQAAVANRLAVAAVEAVAARHQAADASQLAEADAAMVAEAVAAQLRAVVAKLLLLADATAAAVAYEAAC